MAGPTATNIIAGPATLWVAEFGAAEPLDSAVATNPGAPFRDVGGTDDGVTLNIEPEFFKKRMDQTKISPGSVLTGLTLTVATNMVEGTLENMALALNLAEDAIESGGTGGTAWRALNVGGDDDPGAEPNYSAIILRGRGPNGKLRNFIVRKVLSVESVESAYKKDDQFLIPVTFEAHWVSPSIEPMRISEDASV